MERTTYTTPKYTGRRTGVLRIAVLLFGILVFSPFAQDSSGETYWEGSLAVSAYGRLPASGMYAASDAFPLDTKVTVRNMENGRTATVRVVERLDDSRIFMLVSPAVGKKLDIAADEVARAKVRRAVDGAAPLEDSLAQERAYTPDPDVNPAAEVGETGEELARREDGRPAEEEQAAAETGREAEPPAGPAAEPEPEAPNAVQPEAEEQLAEEQQLDQPRVEQPAVEEVTSAEPSEEPDRLAQVQPQEPAAEEPPAEEPAEEEPAAEEQEAEEPAAEQPEPPAPEKVRRTGAAAAEEVPESRDTPEVKRAVEDQGPTVTAMAVRRPAAPAEEVAEATDVPEVRTAEKEQPTPAEEPEKEAPVTAEGPVPSATPPLFPRRVERSWDPAPPEEPAEEQPELAGPAPSLKQLDAPQRDAELAAAGNVPNPPRGRSSLPDSGGTPVPETGRLTLAEPQLPEEKAPRLAEAAPEEEAPQKDAEKEQPAPAEEPEKEPEEPAEGQPIPEESELVLRPAEERPPEGPATEPREREKRPEEEAEGPGEGAPAELKDLLTEKLKETRYYLQVGAYKEAGSAGRLARTLSEEYPVTVYTGEESGGFTYKVMVGPLTEDESGAVLFAFRNRGYSDAFLRRGN
jgi:rare lipoprotein A (peptidoglycan hydrolase)